MTRAWRPNSTPHVQAGGRSQVPKIFMPRAPLRQLREKFATGCSRSTHARRNCARAYCGVLRRSPRRFPDGFRLAEALEQTVHANYTIVIFARRQWPSGLGQRRSARQAESLTIACRGRWFDRRAVLPRARNAIPSVICSTCSPLLRPDSLPVSQLSGGQDPWRRC